ncbi:sigma 54-interacting transcriptional regulator [uncultured Bartonella sp.]|uniref:sigma-54-dependent transcriptional regulator n=1 Tax=uncultured Bartonella sp. TaxID=104108 RepID=UPI0025E66394|nr:sigma 54-interacting transcriptional regulator [uncultured Bartonella sp.]
MMGPILVAAEDYGKRAKISSMLRALGYRVIEAENGLRTLDLLRRRRNISFALVDLMMSDLGGTDLVSTIRVTGFAAPLVVMLDVENEDLLQRSLKAGAVDFLIYPISSLRLSVTLGNLSMNSTYEREVHYIRRQQENHLRFSDLYANSEAMKEPFERAKQAAKTTKNLLIEGEKGTGRETLARVIHHESTYATGKFVRIQCVPISDPLEDNRKWETKILPHINSIDHGTICLCEIDRLEINQQKRWVEFLKKRKELEKDGDPTFRLTAISTSRLQGLVEDGLFLKEFYDLLSECHVILPPLRERRDDFADIAQRAIEHIVVESGQPHVHGVAGSALSLLLQHDWPGNVGELENVLFRAVLLSHGPLLTIRDFPQLTGNQVTDFRSNVPVDISEKNDHHSVHLIGENGQVRAYDELEREIIERTVNHYRGRMSEAARCLGIGRSTLYRKLDEYHAKNRQETKNLRRAS